MLDLKENTSIPEYNYLIASTLVYNIFTKTKPGDFADVYLDILHYNFFHPLLNEKDYIVTFLKYDMHYPTNLDLSPSQEIMPSVMHDYLDNLYDLPVETIKQKNKLYKKKLSKYLKSPFYYIYLGEIEKAHRNLLFTTKSNNEVISKIISNFEKAFSLIDANKNGLFRSYLSFRIFTLYLLKQTMNVELRNNTDYNKKMSYYSDIAKQELGAFLTDNSTKSPEVQKKEFEQIKNFFDRAYIKAEKEIFEDKYFVF